MSKCELCGEFMSEGESMFRFHGHSGPCPKPPLKKTRPSWIDEAAKECAKQVLVGQGAEYFAKVIERAFTNAASPSTEVKHGS